MINSIKYLQTKKMIGDWQSKRLILDRRNQSKSLYFGKMTISPETEVSMKSEQGFKHEFITLHLREKGTLTTNNETYQFSQEYFLDLSTDRCDVVFNNKSLFFSISRLAEKQKIVHLCQPDQYLGQINFVDDSCFMLNFNVLGPQKDYYLKVMYKR